MIAQMTRMPPSNWLFLAFLVCLLFLERCGCFSCKCPCISALHRVSTYFLCSPCMYHLKISFDRPPRQPAASRYVEIPRYLHRY
ncbi:hypothetical protein BDW62DRAFT_174259 [Aspergillus aurantiobrunneus]